MSRKHLFPNLVEPPATEPAENTTPRQRVHMRPLMGAMPASIDNAAPPVGAISRSLEAASQKAKRGEELERKLAEGLTVVALDTSLVDPSFIADRMEAAPDAEATLIEAIREQGQQVPVLVRPHPDSDGRYQLAYGHRRLKAAVALGRSINAVVRPLSDEELAVAQGQENNERRDLSYIEKARFAHSLERRFGRKAVMAALSIYKSDLSNMLSVIERIPRPIVEAIGPASKTGRRGWIELAEAVAKKGALAAIEKAIEEEGYHAKSSDDRLAVALSATRATRAEAKVKVLRDGQRNEIGRLATNGDKIRLTIDRKQSPAFAAFVVDRLSDLFKEFEAGSNRS